MNNVLKVKDLSISYPKSPPIAYPDFNLDKGEFLGLTGPTGSGKTTLLNGLFKRHFIGQVNYESCLLNNKPLREYSDRELYKRVSYLPQFAQDAFNPFLKLNKQLDYICESNDFYDYSLFYKWLEKIQLSREVLSKYPYQLSGGMKQRLLLCFGLLSRPDLYLFDEFTTGIDAITLKIITEFLQDFKGHEFSAIIISHERGFINKITDTLLVLEEKDYGA